MASPFVATGDPKWIRGVLMPALMLLTVWCDQCYKEGNQRRLSGGGIISPATENELELGEQVGTGPWEEQSRSQEKRAQKLWNKKVCKCIGHPLLHTRSKQKASSVILPKLLTDCWLERISFCQLSLSTELVFLQLDLGSDILSCLPYSVHSKRVSGSNSPSWKRITHVHAYKRRSPWVHFRGCLSEACPSVCVCGGRVFHRHGVFHEKEGERDQTGELSGHQVVQAYRPFEETGG